MKKVDNCSRNLLQNKPPVRVSVVAQLVKYPPACKRHRFDPWVRKILCRRAQQHAPVLPGKFHGQRNLAGYSP